MYHRILVPLENSKADETILAHVRPLAREHGAELILVHVADGFVARYQEPLNLADSEEMQKDRAYLEQHRAQLESEGFRVRAILEQGDPAARVLHVAERETCDLIAMATHGHRFLMDLLLGSVASAVRHRAGIPVLMVPVAKT